MSMPHTTVIPTPNRILVCLLTLVVFLALFLSLSKKQSVLADPTTVSEFVGTHSAVQKVLWAKNLLVELGYLSAIDTILFQDIKSTIRLISHKGNSGHTKH